MAEGQSELKAFPIKFFAPVSGQTINGLIDFVEQKLREGIKRFALLISSPGGEVTPGVTAYNFLKGIPAEIITYNLGAVDSVATVLYCVGSKRYCAPQSRFLLHGVVTGMQAGAFDERALSERVKSLQSDRSIISRVVADACQRPLEKVEQDMLQGTLLTAQEAIDYGLAHEMRQQIFASGPELVIV